MIINGRPISKKNNHSGRSGKFFITSKRYKQWETDALRQLKKYKKRWTGKELVIDITIECKGKEDTDLDNMLTSIIDVLQKGEIIENDKYIVHIAASKYHGFKEWRTQIEIWDRND